MKSKFYVLMLILILCFFPQLTASAKENVMVADNEYMAETITAYEVLAEEYLSAELTDEEFVQQYGGSVSVESVPVTNDKISSEAICLVDGNIDNNAECSVILKRITIESDEANSLYVLSAEAKESQSSQEKDGVTLYGTIHWIDYMGTNNVLTHVSGVRYGSWSGDGTYAYGGKYSTLKRGTFSSSGFNDQEYWGTEGSSFHLSVSTPTTSGSTVSLTVTTSIFD